MRANSLSTRIAREVAADIATGDITPGTHIRSQSLADRFKVSRTPIREALEILADQGLLKRQENRGFFVSEAQAQEGAAALSERLSDDTDIYQRLAEDWLTNRLPEEVTEQFLREKYSLTKSQTGDVLMRAVREGWAERKPGYGWHLLPVAKTPEAFDQIYRFRLVIEPAALLEPGFQVDRNALGELRRVQEWMIGADISNVPAERLLINGSTFHEELAKMSGNPFHHMALVRVNRMRRLMEYRANVDRDRLQVQCSEHLEIISTLESGDVVGASYQLRQHLSGALRRKSPLTWDWATKMDSSAPSAS